MHHLCEDMYGGDDDDTEKQDNEGAYMRKTSSVAGLTIWAKKNWRKIWPKNGLKWPRNALNGLKWPKNP